MSAPLPETTRVKGGGSARIGAAIVAVALVAIVWIGISGRPNPTPISAVPPSASSPAPSVASSGLSNARPEPAVPGPSATPESTLEPADAYGATLAMGNVNYVTILTELSPGHLTGELHLPSPPLRPMGRFTFSELWKDGVVEGAVAIDEWAVDLAAVTGAVGSATPVISAIVPAQRALLDAPPPVTSGYEIHVAGTNDLLFTSLSIEIALGVQPGDAHAHLTLGIAADVGKTHREMILASAANGSFKGSFTLPRPRRPSTTHIALYDVQVTDSHSVWTMVREFKFRLTPEMASVGVSKLVLEETDEAYRLMARTNGNVRGQSISVTVIARRFTETE